MIKEKKIKSKNIIIDDYNVPNITSPQIFHDDLFILLKDEVDKKLVDSNRCLKFIKLYIKFIINYSNQKSKFNNYLLILPKIIS